MSPRVRIVTGLLMLAVMFALLFAYRLHADAADAESARAVPSPSPSPVPSSSVPSSSALSASSSAPSPSAPLWSVSGPAEPRCCAAEWLSARFSGDRLILTVDRQCDADSNLAELQVSDATPTVRWAISAGFRPSRATPEVTVGVVPAGFTERVPLTGALSGTLRVRLRTNYTYSAEIDLAALTDGRSHAYRPQPVWAETSIIIPPFC
ncbi:hypothetical protein [Actinoplanes sp. NPDC051851]|uniref:hypothetical protein n=1 Tax=Actinoplanes sp. NPDC051851 TaxID=3154753 RepID=UPI0034268A6E